MFKGTLAWLVYAVDKDFKSVEHMLYIGMHLRCHFSFTCYNMSSREDLIDVEEIGLFRRKVYERVHDGQQWRGG